MQNQVLILLLLFGGAVVAFMLHHSVRALRDVFVIALSIVVGYLVWQLSPADVFSVNIAEFNLLWGITGYSKLFAMLVAVLFFFVALYSHDFMLNKERLGYYYMNLLLTTGGMFGILFSKDLISLFFFWEIMTWSSFMLVIYSGEKAQPVGLKYFVFSAIGAYSILISIVIFYFNFHTVELASVVGGFSSLSVGYQIATVILLLIGFGVKAAVMPLHVWAPKAYELSPSSFTALFSGALSKMGIFGIGIVLFKFAAQAGFYEEVRYILAWIGGLTALLGTFYAVFQTEAKKLLAYSSVSQLGYIVVGLAIGTPLSVMAALFLTVLHGFFKAMLFFAVGAVYRQTGSTDLNEVTGLIRKMPVSFLATLFGIITVAGVPPLAGFAAKWLLYESLLESNHYFLIIIIFAASTAAFLYLYRLIFSLFLGQEEKEYADVKEVPFLMQLPMWILSISVLVIGAFPGILLSPISTAMPYLGLAVPKWETSVLFNSWGGIVDMNTVISSIATIFILAGTFITLKNRKSTRYVTTKDIHTSGEIPTENENLTYAVDFYKPFERALGPTLKASIDKVYNVVAENLEQAFDYLRYIYTGNGQTYALYVVLFLTVLVLFSHLIFGIKL